MKSTNLLLTGVLITISACCLAFVNLRTKAPKSELRTATSPGFAVLELFTSEGCSSCPAADALLGTIQQEYQDKPVFVLAYHVDYWDRLGWKDAFSDVRYSNRQFRYSQLFHSQQYTPQLVVNGASAFVGSNESLVRSSIGQSLKGTSSPLKLSAVEATDRISVDYSYSGMRSAGELKVALVQKKAVRKIKRGENQGRTLTHFQIVRDFESFRLDASGKGTSQFSTPAEFNDNDWEVIGFIQNEETGQIVAAARAEFPNGSQLSNP